MAFLQAGDYENALREFAVADQVAPTPINKYEMALCYDRLGNAGPAIALYRQYLELVPEATPERAEATASIARLSTPIVAAPSPPAPTPVVTAPPPAPPRAPVTAAHKEKHPSTRLTEAQLRDKLAELDRLKAKGLITEAEYQQKKKALLDQL